MGMPTPAVLKAAPAAPAPKSSHPTDNTVTNYFKPAPKSAPAAKAKSPGGEPKISPAPVVGFPAPGAFTGVHVALAGAVGCIAILIAIFLGAVGAVYLTGGGHPAPHAAQAIRPTGCGIPRGITHSGGFHAGVLGVWLHSTTSTNTFYQPPHIDLNVLTLPAGTT